jgi:hypothetical protein
LLARKAEETTGHLHRALRRASRAAFLWPVEARDLSRAGRSLTELPAIGPHLEKLLSGAIDTDAHAPEQLFFVELGLAAALLAGVDPDRIVNFMEAAELLRWASHER